MLTLLRYYERIQEVVSFVQRLPMQWDSFVDDCKKRAAPPLVDETIQTFGLRSPVLQTTTFRAIARAIHGGSDSLEHLHRLDQQAFFCGQSLMTTYEKGQAYDAFRDAMKQLKEHEKTPINQHKPFIIPPKVTNLIRRARLHLTNQETVNASKSRDLLEHSSISERYADFSTHLYPGTCCVSGPNPNPNFGSDSCPHAKFTNESL